MLIKVVSDSVCVSTYKAVNQGTAHKRMPEDIAQNPVMVGHELCGVIVEVGQKLRNTWKVGQKVVLQPALKLPNNFAPGYSYPYIGGNTQYAVVPEIVLDKGCLLPYDGGAISRAHLRRHCGYKGFYHTDHTNYQRMDGAKKVCYNELDLPLVAISDFAELGKTNEMHRQLDRIVKENGGIWCVEAEEYLLAHAPKL